MKQETSSPNFDLITLQAFFLMQQMLIFSVFAEEYKFDPIVMPGGFLNPAMLIFVRVATAE